MRAYLCNDSGSGKTLFIAILILIYCELNPLCEVYANFNLNIYNKKTHKKMCHFAIFGLIPFSRIKLGHSLIALDDFYALRNSEFFTSILAVLSRKAFIETYISIQYYTDITKRMRNLCQYEIQPILSNLTNEGILSKESTLELRFYNPKSMNLEFSHILYNVLDFLNNAKIFNNVYIKGNLYDTNEIVDFDSYSLVIEKISEISETFQDIEINSNIYTKNQTKVNKIINDVCKIKGIENKLKIKKVKNK